MIKYHLFLIFSLLISFDYWGIIEYFENLYISYIHWISFMINSMNIKLVKALLFIN